MDISGNPDNDRGKAMARKGKQAKAIAYMRTSSAANIGEGKDSDKRQRAAIEGYAKEAGYTIAEDDWFYDKVVKGADSITSRPGFAAMLARIAGNGVRVIIVESPDRFARDLLVQLTGHDHLKKLGVSLIPASAPDYFLEDTPTARLVRQVLGAIAEFDKATLVAKLKGARDRKRAAGDKVEGRKSWAEINPEMVQEAKRLRRKTKAGQRSLRAIAAELATLGYVNERGAVFSPAAIASMLAAKP
jgi:DNA invertase Pin-like site-specific DNA recombinase